MYDVIILELQLHMLKMKGTNPFLIDDDFIVIIQDCNHGHVRRVRASTVCSKHSSSRTRLAIQHVLTLTHRNVETLVRLGGMDKGE